MNVPQLSLIYRKVALLFLYLKHRKIDLKTSGLFFKEARSNGPYVSLFQ